MEHESDSSSENSANQQGDLSENQHDEQPKKEPAGCLKIFLRLLIGGIVLFIVVVALVFGACWFGQGSG